MPGETVDLARFLIGTTLVHRTSTGVLAGRIVESEAYVVGDASSHAFRGPTDRNRAMFLECGHAYVYLIYGLSWCLNVSSEVAGVGAAVLIRAVEPLVGLEEMRRRRGSDRPERDLTRGPGRLCRAFGIDRRLDGVDLCAGGPLGLCAPVRRPGEIGASVRIGLTRETERVLRFYERANPYVSGPAALRR